MGEKQGIKYLKLRNCRNDMFYPTDWIAGVDYAENANYNNDNNNDDKNYDDKDHDDNDDHYHDDADIDDKEAYDRIDQAELDKLLAEPHKDDNTRNKENDNANPIVKE